MDAPGKPWLNEVSVGFGVPLRTETDGADASRTFSDVDRVDKADDEVDEQPPVAATHAARMVEHKRDV